MLNLFSTLSAFVLCIGFSVPSIAADNCESVDLRAKGQSMEKIKPLKQVYGSCFANAAAQLIDAYRIKSGEPADHYQTDPLYLAINFTIEARGCSEIGDEHKNCFSGGWSFGSIQKIAERPFCLLRDLKSDTVFVPNSELYRMSRISKPETLEQLIRITNQVRELQLQKYEFEQKAFALDFKKSIVLVPDALRTRMTPDPIEAIDKKMQILETQMDQLHQEILSLIQPSATCKREPIAQSIFTANLSAPFFGVSTPADMVRSTLLRDCREHGPLKVDTVDEDVFSRLCEQKKIQGKNCENLSDVRKRAFTQKTLKNLPLEQRQQAILERIQVGGQPLGIGISVFDLINQKPGQKPGLVNTPANHEILIIGKRRQGGSCQVLVRNSWGACDPKAKKSAEFPNSICDTDAFWIDVDQVASKTLSVFKFPN